MNTGNYNEMGNYKGFGYYLKKIFFYIIKVIGKLVINLFIAFIFFVFLAAMFSTGFKEEEVIANDSYLKLSFPQDVKEEARKSLFSEFGTQKTNLYGVLQAIEIAGTDERIRGIVLDLDNFALSGEHSEEVKEKLVQFRKMGKKIYAYGASISNAAYKMALVADVIVMPPSASADLTLKGYYYATPYYKKLADKLGVKFTIINTGDFKTYGENYTKENISKELREELVRIYDERFGILINDISTARKIDRKVIEDKLFNGDFAMLTPTEAKEAKLVDKLMYEKDFERNELKSTTNGKNMVSLSRYVAQMRNSLESKSLTKDKIAVIYAEGEISNSSSEGSGFSDDGIVTPAKISRKLRLALEDSSIKGIVIRVNSPGGSALASDLIMNDIALAKKRKTIYVSMGNVAASGGYYISCIADKIFANGSTITGSIGVVSMIPSFEGLTEKIGINIDTIKKGKYSDLYNMTRELTPDEIQFLHKKMLLTYNEFKTNVAKGRTIDFGKVEEIAQGKIWTGNEAKKIKLVDNAGGLLTTVNNLAKDIGISDYEVYEMSDTDNIWSKISELSSGMDSKSAALETTLKASGVYDALKEYEKAVKYDRKPALLLPFELNDN